MIFNMSGKAGGISLKLKTAPSIENLPVSATVGEVYLITETELTGVTYFQPTQPTGTFKQGDVWVRTDETSPTQVNLVKHGSIIVGVFETYVWNGTEWSSVAFRVRSESGWGEPGVLFASGAALVEFTTSNTRLTANEGYVSLKAPSGSSGYYRTTEQIDLTNYTTLKIKAKKTGVPAVHAAVWTAADVKTNLISITTVLSEYTADVTELTGFYYVGVWGANDSGSGTYSADLYNLILE